VAVFKHFSRYSLRFVFVIGILPQIICGKLICHPEMICHRCAETRAFFARIGVESLP
jgi:hypothetical protein